MHGALRALHDWAATHEGILKPSSAAHHHQSHWRRYGMGKFFAGPTNKAVQSFTDSLIRVREW